MYINNILHPIFLLALAGTQMRIGETDGTIEYPEPDDGGPLIAHMPSHARLDNILLDPFDGPLPCLLHKYRREYAHHPYHIHKNVVSEFLQLMGEDGLPFLACVGT